MALISTIMFLFQLGFGGYCASVINTEWLSGMFPAQYSKWVTIILTVIIFFIGMWIGYYIFIFLCVILVIKML